MVLQAECRLKACMVAYTRCYENILIFLLATVQTNEKNVATNIWHTSKYI